MDNTSLSPAASNIVVANSAERLGDLAIHANHRSVARSVNGVPLPNELTTNEPDWNFKKAKAESDAEQQMLI